MENNIGDEILGIIAEAIDMDKDEINIDMPYSEYGIDSILSIEVIAKLNRKLNINLKTTDLFNYTTIRSLSEYIMKEFEIKLKKSDEVESKVESYNVLSEERTETIDELLKIISYTIGEDMELIDKESQFEELGIDSILSIELIDKINKKFNISLKVTDLFNYPNIKELSIYINSLSSDNTVINIPYEEEKQEMKHLDFEELDYDDLFKEIDELSHVEDLDVSYVDEKEEIKDTDIAIIGMSGVFPEADNLDEFWKNIKQGNDCVTEFKRWDIDKYYDKTNKEPNKINSKWGGFLNSIDEFDPMFFNISSKEAEYMDPQQRLFLQQSYKALEDAGYNSKMMNNVKCGVYVGCAPGEYKSLLVENGKDLNGYMFLGTSESILSARISYFLNLNGPSLSINTACSSSGVSIHLACQSIIDNECDMALAGGVCVFSRPDFYQHVSKLNMLSPTGRCYTFDNKADGFVPAEAVGVLVLKRLKDAIRDNDNIYGVIEGSGINQDGKTNGIMAPNSLSQENLISFIYDKYNINPENITYVEAHGTGTKLGDPIEVEALSKSFRKFTSKEEYCALGSVKANMGHALTASAVVGVMKVLLCMKNNTIPPMVHYEKCNEHIQLENSPFYINTEAKQWSSNSEEEKHASISSFGFSGVNFHIVLREYKGNKNVKKTGNNLIVLSGKTKSALSANVENMQKWIKKHGKETDISNLAANLQLGRSHFKYRTAFIAHSIDEATEKLSEIDLVDINNRKIPNSSEKLNSLINRINEKIQDGIQYEDEMNQLCDLYMEGYDIDFSALSFNKEYKKISIPSYEFDKEKFWSIKDEGSKKENHKEVLHPLLKNNISSLKRQRFVSDFNMDDDFIKDHIINKKVLMPAVNYLEMAFSGADISTETTVNELRDIYFLNSEFEDKEMRPISIQYYEENMGIKFEIVNKEKAVLSKGIVGLKQKSEDLKYPKFALQNYESITGEKFYESIRSLGYEYGESFRCIENIQYSVDKAVAKLTTECIKVNLDKFRLNTFILDAALQTGLVLMVSDRSSTYVPYYIEKIVILDNNYKYKNKIKVCIELVKDLENTKEFNLTLLDEENNALVYIHKYIVKKQKDTLVNENTKEDSIYELLKKLEAGLIDIEDVEKGVRNEWD